MRNRTTTSIIAASALALTLAGCSVPSDAAPAPSGAPSSSTNTMPPLGAEYPTVAALKDAAVAAGYTCPNWQQTNVVTAAKESGTCSDADVFSTYAEPGGATQQARTLAGMDDTTTLLVGPNWIINANEASTLQNKIGGAIFGGATSSPDATESTTDTTYTEPTAEDFTVDVKILSKKCFGSAGCNVEYVIDNPSASAVLDPEGEWTVTYEVEGLEDGQIGNFDLSGDGKVSFYPETGQTTTSKAKLTAKVTDVTRRS